MKHALAATALLAFTAPAALAGDGTLALNHVWSSLADVNGELGSVESAEFDPASTRIVTGTKFDNTVRVFRVTDGTQIWSRTVPQEIERVAWTRDGARVMSVSEDGLMRVFDAETGEVLARHQHDNGIDGLTVSHDGRFVVSGQERVDGEGVLRVFDGQGDNLLAALPFPGTVNEVDFSSDDTMLAAVGDHTARIYEVRGDDPGQWPVRHEWTLPKDAGPYKDDLIYINTKFSPAGDMLAVGAAYGYVYLYDTRSGTLLRAMQKSAEKTETVAWTSEGKHLLVAGNGMSIDVFRTEDILNEDYENSEQIPLALRVPVTDALEYMDFNEMGTLLTTAHQDGTVQLWTFMSDDPTINERQHRKVRREQDEQARRDGRYV
ncbi:MAG: PQQ-binding-like beta-propeller repeat protein, partial [Erythrobacter sp.]|nr:PQQ-binding-like beta-propeller repeat protein [Erythrobacter sp.]